MLAYTLNIKNLDQIDLNTLVGQVVGSNVPAFHLGKGFAFRKGQILTEHDYQKIPELLAAAPANFGLHLIKLEAGDINEDEAGQQLAAMVAGQGLVQTAPVESRTSLLAKWRGLLKVDVFQLDKLNELPGVAVFTLFNDQAVESGTEVAGAKVTPLVYSEKHLREARAVISNSPIVQIKPFLPRKVGVVVRESLAEKARLRFEEAVNYKIAWFGGQLLGIETATGETTELTEKLGSLQKQGAELILHVGGHSSDPLDPIYDALDALHVQVEKQGAPAHPGTLFWLGYFPQGDTAIFGLASCGMFSRTTLGDLFMAKFFAGERITYKDVARMGHGGLLGREMAFRFPPYNLSLDKVD